MTTAMVLSGGASLGALQVGMLQALQEHGVQPDLLVGTSVGAVNAAWLAAHPDRPVSDLAAIWVSLRRQDVFPTRPFHGLVGFLGRRRGLVPAGRLHGLIERHLTFDRLEDAPIPLHVVVTDVLTSADVALASGPAARSVLASASIPGVLPPVEIGGRYYMDGGVVNNTPISHAVTLGADEIWVLPTGWSCALSAPPRGALGMALHGLNCLVHQRLAADIEHQASHGVNLRVVPPPCPVSIQPADFSAGAALVDAGYHTARAWLEHSEERSDDHAEAIGRLRPHRHDDHGAGNPIVEPPGVTAGSRPRRATVGIAVSPRRGR